MTRYDFDQVHDRKKSDSIKWNMYGDALPMWVADMDFPSPEPVIQALVERARHGIFGYPDGVAALPNDLAELREILVERMARLYQWKIEPEALVFLPGVVTGFNLACFALTAPEHGILIQTPVYPPILHAAATTGRTGQEMELTCQDNGAYCVDWERFTRSIEPTTRLFLLCNPHNPVGRVFERKEIERFAEICLREDLYICSDEIHCDLVYPGHPHLPIASLDPEIGRRCVTLMAPSKTFNIAGLQCSFAIIPDRDLRKRYLKARNGLVPWVNLMGLEAAKAAYLHGQEWLDQLLAYLQSNRDALESFVEQRLPGIKMSHLEGTYLAWLDCRAAELGGENNPYTFFLEKAGVATNDGVTFGQGGAGFVRFNFACPRSLMDQALERMESALLGKPVSR
jgi:cysteine-S-conjugate beta-lyase